jgi:fructose-1,6-bisphosphatase class II
MMNNMELALATVCELSAVGASAEIGRGDKLAVDEIATSIMRQQLNLIPFKGKIAVAEGKKDEAPTFAFGEQVGAGWKHVLSSAGSPVEQYDEGDYYDLAIDPVDGTTQTSKGGNEAMSVITVGGKNSLFSSEVFYMQKIAVGPQVCSKVELNITDSISRTIKLVSLALSKESSKLIVCMLDRPRHADTVAYLRRLGCRVKLIQDCDVSAAIATAIPESGIDIYMGVGGVTEGVISAVSMKCMNGFFQGRLCDAKGEPVDDKVYNMTDLAKGDVMFCATGITNGSLLKGVRYTSYGKAITNSVVMRSNNHTVRWITTEHGN